MIDQSTTKKGWDMEKTASEILLRELVEAWREPFEAEAEDGPEWPVNGSDCVEWLREFWDRARIALEVGR